MLAYGQRQRLDSTFAYPVRTPDYRAGDQLLVVRAAHSLCALPLDLVVETMRPLPCEPIAGAPAFVLGLSLIRSHQLPVIDLAMVVGSGGGRHGRFITVRTGSSTRDSSATSDGQVALAVEEVVGVYSRDQLSEANLPPLLSEANPEVIDSIGRLDADLLLVLRSGSYLPEGIAALEKPAP